MGWRLRLVGAGLAAAAVAGGLPMVVDGTAPQSTSNAPLMVGINEAVSVPLRLMIKDRMSDATVDAHHKADAIETARLGARVVRMHSAGHPGLAYDQWLARGRSFDVTDRWLRIVQEQGIDVVMMISPWPGNQTAEHTKAYSLSDPDGYSAFVKAAVERYDGDGVDDMEGLRAGVVAWEVDNEPDLKNTLPPKGQAGFDPVNFCTPTQYADMLVKTAAWIRAADPDAVVLNGGFFRPMTGPGKTYMEAVFRQPGTVDAIDALNLHIYFHDPKDIDRFDAAVEAGRRYAPGKPVWITETSLSIEPGDAAAEVAQAEFMVQLIARALRLDVKAVFWHSLVDPPLSAAARRKGPGMTATSLLRTTESGQLEEKPAAVAFKRMVALLDGAKGPVEVNGTSVRLGDAWLAPDGRWSWQGPEATVERARDGAPQTPTRSGEVWRVSSDAAVIIRPSR
ncbi:MAG: hypothetical protein H6739_22780 [Alphaproteobacteria bacterium]|nr:hypothetical protein [Alphaproteobacteria bacterium]